MAKAQEAARGGDEGAEEGSATLPEAALPPVQVVCPECGSAACRLLRARDVATHLGVAVSSVYSMTSRRLLPRPVYIWKKGDRRGGPRWRSCVLNAALSPATVPGP